MDEIFGIDKRIINQNNRNACIIVNDFDILPIMNSMCNLSIFAYFITLPIKRKRNYAEHIFLR